MRRWLEEMVARPVAAMTAGLELLAVEMTTGERIDGMVSRTLHTLSRTPGGGVERQAAVAPMSGPAAEGSPRAPAAPLEPVAGPTVEVGAGDELELVRHQVVFVRREYEHAFPEKEELVDAGLDGEAFTAWKIAEFMQEIKKGETQVPERWRAKGYPGPPHVRGDKLLGLPAADGKYLRLQYRVLDRHARFGFNRPRREVRVLTQIRDALGGGER